MAGKGPDDGHGPRKEFSGGRLAQDIYTVVSSALRLRVAHLHLSKIMKEDLTAVLTQQERCP